MFNHMPHRLTIRRFNDNHKIFVEWKLGYGCTLGRKLDPLKDGQKCEATLKRLISRKFKSKLSWNVECYLLYLPKHLDFNIPLPTAPTEHIILVANSKVQAVYRLSHLQCSSSVRDSR
jgi:hypothetical protein